MENKIIAKQIIDFYKSTFDNNFNSLTILQQQTEKMVQTFMEQATWIPAEGKAAINEWLSVYSKGRIGFKEAADNNFKKVEEIFAAGETVAKTKTSKTK
ncbi:MAG: hypothetical protein CVU52_06640 [Deltaproteobacteria bacterium HGW-Deltaproteobacteria-10]|nr:MAG: hypothetical protein CVU52_06640 [Deltaproteobacteria bacterium HGW-Deltaproteobacteria-10]